VRKRSFSERFGGWAGGWRILTLWILATVTLAPLAARGQGTSAGGSTNGSASGGNGNTLYAPILVSGRHIIDVASNGAISAADRATALQILTQTKPAFATFAQTLNAQNTSAPRAQAAPPTT